MTELEVVAQQVRVAEDYTEVFGACAGEACDIPGHVKRIYRKLARILHPDNYTVPTDKSTAQAAFQRLNQFHADALKAIREHRYGERLRLAVIRTKRATHEIIRTAGAGDLCDTFAAQTDTGVQGASFVKVAKRPADRDLLQTEATALKRMRGTDADPKWQPFVPELLDTFVYSEASKPRRQANVLARLEGFYNLEQVKAAFPGGPDPLHMVWIWRRLLVAIGHAQDHQVVHGAVVPRHVMIAPELHGLVLVDWCYASVGADGGQPPIKAIVDDYKDWYPAEVFAKETPGPATDIAMATRTMIWLMGGNPLTAAMPARVPRPIRAFLRGCLQTSLSARPDDAWRLLKEFDELLVEMGPPYYPRRFRPFTMPNGA